MGNEANHRKSAAIARGVAEELRTSQPAWALVPLFYSSMHELHARLVAKGQGSTDDYFHPKHHHSSRDERGDVVKWGTLDVIVLEFPSPVVTAYRELHKVSELVRYKHMDSAFDTTRYWAYADEIVNFGS